MLTKPITIKKGSVLILNYTGIGNVGGVGVDMDDQDVLYRSDFILASNYLKEFKYRFLINSIIETGHYIDLIQINKTYPIYYAFTFKLKISTSDIYLQSIVNINYNKSFMSNLTYINQKNFAIFYKYSNSTSCSFKYIDKLKVEIAQYCGFSKFKITV